MEEGGMVDSPLPPVCETGIFETVLFSHIVLGWCWVLFGDGLVVEI